MTTNKEYEEIIHIHWLSIVSDLKMRNQHPTSWRIMMHPYDEWRMLTVIANCIAYPESTQVTFAEWWHEALAR